ncbi:Imm7 family immunity protein [Ideonella sp.]|uniref:Imm7 family immunity protein n=1 Tax=Ideonella sp. TaxID=1929293 RepID=UPI0039C88CA9
MILSVGWCVLRSSRIAYAHTSAEDARLMDEAIAEADARLWVSFREWMASNSSPLLLWTLHEQHNNHQGMLQVYLSRNHRGSPFWDMLGWIAEHGPSSYGLFYVNDDEESDSSGNVFRVHRIMSGRVDEMPDPFFGPIVPNLESEHPYNRDIPGGSLDAT